jgi:hypothetical protein
VTSCGNRKCDMNELQKNEYDILDKIIIHFFDLL